MCGLKRRILAVTAMMLLTAPATSHAGMTQVFAECVARLSAETEHAWLMGGQEADTYQSQRLVFLTLLDATLSQDSVRRTLSYRIEVKAAHSSLLTLATFGQNEQRATQARNLAARHLAGCQRLLLGG